MSNDLPDFGELLKRERLKRGLSLRSAGAKIGISHSYLASLENGGDPRTGNRLVPSQDVLYKICAAYELELGDASALLGFGEEERLLFYMADRIHRLKKSDPARYRELLNIVIGNESGNKA